MSADNLCGLAGCGHTRFEHKPTGFVPHEFVEQAKSTVIIPQTPIPMLLHCPMCLGRHIDKGKFATKPHATHACQFCGHVWKPALVDTVGVQFLPGYKDEDAE